MRNLPDQDTLKELLNYDPDTGQLTWKARSERWFSSKRAAAIWNTRFPGKPALSTVGNDGRRQGYLLWQMTKAHRVIWKMVHGTEPQIIDHIDGDPGNNRLANLRNVSHAVNMRNARIRPDNKSGVPGVHFDKSRQRYLAYVDIDGKRKNIGRFKTFEEAVEARRAAAKDFFHENHGRPIRDD